MYPRLDIQYSSLLFYLSISLSFLYLGLYLSISPILDLPALFPLRVQRRYLSVGSISPLALRANAVTRVPLRNVECTPGGATLRVRGYPGPLTPPLSILFLPLHNRRVLCFLTHTADCASAQ